MPRIFLITVIALSICGTVYGVRTWKEYDAKKWERKYYDMAYQNWEANQEAAY